MGLTAFSFILLPLCLLWGMSPERLLKLMAVVSIFEAAAAITIGSFGVQPGLVPGLGFMGYMGLQFLLGARSPALPTVWQQTQPFVLVTLWAITASYLMPHIFQDQIYVWPQKVAPPFVPAYLEPSMSNVNQDIYLLIDCIFLVFASTFMTTTKLSLRIFLRAYFASGYLAATVSIWQFANRVVGLPYPDELFYSNPGWAILTSQQIGTVPRINGPFAEPSALGAYMASIMCATGWLLLKGRYDRSTMTLFAVAIVTLMLSTSSTGLGVLAVVGVGVPLYAVLSGSFGLMSATLRLYLPVALFAAMLFVIGALFVPSFSHNIQEILDGTLNKRDSESYEARTGADLDSLAVTLDTYGLGVGWGSNRSSSLIPGLLAGVGVPGFLGLLWFGGRVATRARKALDAELSEDLAWVIDGTCGGLVGFLIAAIASAPTITSMTFFYLLSLLIASSTRALHTAGRAAPHARPGLSASAGP